MTRQEERDFEAYLDSQSNPALTRFEMANERAWQFGHESAPEAYDEMVSQDMEGRS